MMFLFLPSNIFFVAYAHIFAGLKLLDSLATQVQLPMNEILIWKCNLTTVALWFLYIGGSEYVSVYV